MREGGSELSADEATVAVRLLRTIRESVREIVERVLADVPGDPDSRPTVRAAGDHLVEALIAHADGAASTSGPSRATGGTAPRGVVRPYDHALAFRVMTGVRG